MLARVSTQPGFVTNTSANGSLLVVEMTPKILVLSVILAPSRLDSLLLEGTSWSDRRAHPALDRGRQACGVALDLVVCFSLLDFDLRFFYQISSHAHPQIKIQQDWKITFGSWKSTALQTIPISLPSRAQFAAESLGLHSYCDLSSKACKLKLDPYLARDSRSRAARDASQTMSGLVATL